MKKILSIFTVDKYYKMEDAELEKEASKWKIRGYVDNKGHRPFINRKIIIDQLIKKDQANNSRYAIFISVVALIIGILALIF